MKKTLSVILCAALVISGIGALAAEPFVWYTFDDMTAKDVSGSGNDGIINDKDFLWTDGADGSRALYINTVDGGGDNTYVILPDGIVKDLTDFTICAWARTGENRDWARLFDFGTSDSNYMFFCLRSNGGQSVFAITTSGNGGEQKVAFPTTFTKGDEWQHVAITKSGTTCIVYIDGVEKGRNENMTLSPKDLGVTDKNTIGKSQYPDPVYHSKVDDFRIYNTALSADEVMEIVEAVKGEQRESASFGEHTIATRMSKSGDAVSVSQLVNGGNAENAIVVLATLDENKKVINVKTAKAELIPGGELVNEIALDGAKFVRAYLWDGGVNFTQIAEREF